MATTSIAAARPPAQPTAILRGHRAQVHAAIFARLDQTASSPSSSGETMTADTRLVTGDSDGYVVLWDLAIVRARGVWRAHQNSILGIAAWDDAGQIVTHGRDHKLVVWQVGVADETRLSTVLPLDQESKIPKTSSGSASTHPQPWMVHVLDVNTMNFCAFAWCGLVGSVAAVTTVANKPSSSTSTDTQLATTTPPPAQRLVVVPNTLTLEAADIYHLPSQRRINTVRLGTKEGMIMAVAVFYAPVTESTEDSQRTLVLIAAFENGVAVVALLRQGADGPAEIVYRAQPHSQPILSLDVAPDCSYFLTSAADAVIAKHPIRMPATPAAKKAAGAPAPARPSVSSAPAPVPASSTGKPVSLLSAALSKEAATSSSSAPPPKGAAGAAPSRPIEVETQPLTVINTKHAGQQGIRLRDDGRLFATAGWDARVRVYAAQTMKEVAVLKWHQTGCFTVAFAPVVRPDGDGEADAATSAEGTSTVSTTTALVSQRSQSTRRDVSVKERRLRHAVTAHWLAVGSKDGKVSLWDIF